jgi:NAD(P)-dependent dehydrogenase (short-subunit alcohol dehydrogenase family)
VAATIDLAGSVAIVTGASVGLGKAISRALAEAGAHVTIIARDKHQLAQAAEEVRSVGAVEGQQVLAVRGDVRKPSDVRRAFQMTVDRLGRIDSLVCNAGVFGPLGRLEEVDWSDWEDAVATNLFGVVHCCREAIPVMRQQRAGRIIVLSGGGATSPMPRFSAYAASKAAVVRLVETLALELRDDGILINAVAPGVLDTRLLDQVLAAGPEVVGDEFHARMLAEKERGGTPLELGARVVCFLASDSSGAITGKLISAVWDRWSELPAMQERLMQSDVYTLRRIVPADRGWGE